MLDWLLSAKMWSTLSSGMQLDFGLLSFCISLLTKLQSKCYNKYLYRKKPQKKIKVSSWHSHMCTCLECIWKYKNQKHLHCGLSKHVISFSFLVTCTKRICKRYFRSYSGHVHACELAVSLLAFACLCFFTNWWTRMYSILLGCVLVRVHVMLIKKTFLHNTSSQKWRVLFMSVLIYSINCNLANSYMPGVTRGHLKYK